VNPVYPFHDVLVRAINERRLIEVRYRGGPARVAEPHDYGVQQSVTRVFVYQLSGPSRSGKGQGWRRLDADHIESLHVLEHTFPGSRSEPSQHHQTWDVLYARAK